MRLSVYLADRYGVSRRFAKLLIQAGKVYKNGSPVKKDEETEPESSYMAHIDHATPIYDKNSYLIQAEEETLFLEKPPFMHTERLTPSDPLCLDDVIMGAFPEFKLVSRLDYGVSGVVGALKQGITISGEYKRYLAWVAGCFPGYLRGRWEVDAHKRKKVLAFESPAGEEMVFNCLKVSGGLSLIEISLIRAARHQVRAVCALLGYPIAGDALYGDPTLKDCRIALHCAEARLNGIQAYSPNNEAFMAMF